MQTAITKAEKKLGGSISSITAEGFLTRVADKKNRMPFGEAIRFSLTESYIQKPDDRKLYSSLAGFFFGTRGNAAKAARAQASRTSQSREKAHKNESVVGQTFVEDNGQGAFRV